MEKKNLFFLPRKPFIEEPEMPRRRANRKKVLEFRKKTNKPIDYATRDALFIKGFDADTLGNDDQAAQFYMQSISVDPNSAGAWINLGTLAFRKKDWVNAEKYYRKAEEIDPDYPLAHFNLGNYFHEMGKIKEAEEYYLRALKKHPGYLDVHYNLGLLYQQSDRPHKAHTHWTTYIRRTTESDPDLHVAKKERAKLEIIYGQKLISGRELSLVHNKK